MSTTLTNSYDGGTNGTALTGGSGEGGTSGNYFDTVSIGASATCAYDATHAATGGLSCKIATPVSAVSSYMYSKVRYGSIVPALVASGGPA